MNDIIQPLQGDERIVMEILASGGSISPIGRWEAPVKSLIAKGLVNLDDPANTSLTDAGRETWEGVVAAQETLDDDFARGLIEIHNAKIKINDLIKSAAAQLRKAAQLSSAITKNTVDVEIRNWSDVLKKAALDS